MKTWQLQDAKARLSQLVNDSHQEPQIISRYGKDECIVLSIEQYKKLTQKKETLVSFLKRSPLYGIEIDFERDSSPSRKVKF